MKRRVYLYYIALPLLLLLAGCVREPMGGLLIPEGKVGDSITLTLGLHADDLRELVLRSEAINDDEVEKISSLRILVFNEHQEFLYSTDAVLENPASADTFGDDAFLPDGKKGSIQRIKSFTATFIQSDKPRYLHFVANYDWTGQRQDYFLVGNSAGAIIPNLTTSIESANGSNGKTKAFDPMWAQVRLNELNSESLQGKVVKLLRCHAKVTVVDKTPETNGFQLTGFTACNVHKSGTVAPFVMENYAFSFPYAPTKATTPPDVETILNNDPTDLVPENTEFKIFEHQNDGDKKVFLIIQGKKQLKNGSTETRYYKVDFVAKRNKENIVSDRVLPIIRNNHYKVTITAVNSDGYATMDEAIAAPAHNNIFSSIELQEFTQISDEMFTLKADPVQILIVRPGTYHFNTEFAITDSNYRFKSYESGPANSGAQYLRYYKRWSDNDPYIGALTQTEVSKRSGNDDHFSVKVKNIPSDAVERYSIEVAGLRSYAPEDTPPANPNDLYTYERVDGGAVSGATTPLIRNVEITIRKPLLFNTALVDDPKSSKKEDRLLEFDLYKNLPKGIFPFEVLIEAPDLSPRNTEGNTENLTIVKRDGKVYYRYLVKTDSYNRHNNGRVRIPMVVNDGTDSPSHDIVLSSPYYNTETIYPSTTTYKSKPMHLYFKVPGTSSSRRVMPNTSQFVEKGSTIPSGVYRIEPTASDGQFKLIYDTKKAQANLNQELTLESVFLVQSNYGYISFAVRATKKLSEWVASDSHDFTATSVKIKGQLQHYDNGAYYPRPTQYPPLWWVYDTATRQYTDVSRYVTIASTPSEYQTYPYDYKLHIPQEVFRATMSGLMIDYYGYNKPVFHYWDQLMNTTRIIWSPR